MERSFYYKLRQERLQLRKNKDVQRYWHVFKAFSVKNKDVIVTVIKYVLLISVFISIINVEIDLIAMICFVTVHTFVIDTAITIFVIICVPTLIANHLFAGVLVANCDVEAAFLQAAITVILVFQRYSFWLFIVI